MLLTRKILCCIICPIIMLISGYLFIINSFGNNTQQPFGVSKNNNISQNVYKNKTSETFSNNSTGGVFETNRNEYNDRYYATIIENVTENQADANLFEVRNGVDIKNNDAKTGYELLNDSLNSTASYHINNPKIIPSTNAGYDYGFDTATKTTDINTVSETDARTTLTETTYNFNFDPATTTIDINMVSEINATTTLTETTYDYNFDPATSTTDINMVSESDSVTKTTYTTYLSESDIGTHVSVTDPAIIPTETTYVTEIEITTMPTDKTYEPETDATTIPTKTAYYNEIDPAIIPTETTYMSETDTKTIATDIDTASIPTDTTYISDIDPYPPTQSINPAFAANNISNTLYDTNTENIVTNQEITTINETTDKISSVEPTTNKKEVSDIVGGLLDSYKKQVLIKKKTRKIWLADNYSNGLHFNQDQIEVQKRVLTTFINNPLLIKNLSTRQAIFETCQSTSFFKGKKIFLYSVLNDYLNNNPYSTENDNTYDNLYEDLNEQLEETTKIINQKNIDFTYMEDFLLLYIELLVYKNIWLECEITSQKKLVFHFESTQNIANFQNNMLSDLEKIGKKISLKDSGIIVNHFIRKVFDVLKE